MRALLALVAVVLILAIVGWIKFSDSPERSTVTIEKDTVRQDTEAMVDRGNEFLENAQQTVNPPTDATIDRAPSNDNTAPRDATPDTPAVRPSGNL